MTNAMKDNLKATSDTIAELANALETYTWDESNLQIKDANEKLIDRARFIEEQLNETILELSLPPRANA
jgi:hypothetical protein